MFPLLSIFSVSFLLASASPISVNTANCTTGVHILVARDTTEPPGTGFQSVIANAIARAIPGSDIVAVDYPAGFDVITSLAAGVKDLQSKATSYAQQCPNSKIVLMGYSQGAQVVGDSVSGGGTPTPFGSPSPAAIALGSGIGAKIVAIIQFGDPNRVIGQGTDAFGAKCTVDAKTARTGANKAKFAEYAARTQEWCNAGDPVCCSSGSKFLAHLSYFTGDTGAKAAKFVQARLGN